MKDINKKRYIYEGKKADDFKQLINSVTEECPNKIAFTIRDEKHDLKDVSFNEFRNDIKALGTAFISLGGTEQKIGILLPDRYEWCLSYLAITTSNNIAIPFDYLLPDNELENLIIDSKAEIIIFSKKHLEIIKKIILEKQSALKTFICLDGENPVLTIKTFNNLLSLGEDLLKSGDTSYDDQVMDKDKLAVLIYTSGTTSHPKAVMLSQYNICTNVSNLTKTIAYEENDSMLVFLPLHHTLACTASFLYCYFTGFRIYFADSIKDLGNNLKEFQISGLVAVPAVLDIMYRRAIKAIKNSNKYFTFKVASVISNTLLFFGIDKRRKIFKTILDNFGGRLKRIIYGSASTEPEVTKFFHTIGVDMLQGYGLTETSPVISAENDKYNSRTSCAGYPLPGNTIKILDPDKNGIGEILSKGPNIMLGYYNDSRKTAETIIDGWIHTGDLGRIDKQGRLYVTGRKKDLIVLNNGKKVFPDELENVVNSVSGVLDSFVFALDDKICVKIVYDKRFPEFKGKNLKEIHYILNDKIVKLNATLPVYKNIKKVFISSEPLIKTTTGKIKRSEEMKTIK